MTLIFQTGFEAERRLERQWTQVEQAVIATNANRPHAVGSSRYGVRLPGPASRLALRVADADASALMVVGVAIRRTPAQTPALALLSDNLGTTHLTIVCEADGRVATFRGGRTGTLLGRTLTAPMTPNVWHYLEVKATLADALGLVVVQVNGVAGLSLAAADTKNGGTKTVFDGFRLEGAGEVDDVYLLNGGGVVNNVLGPQYIVTDVPPIQGSRTQSSRSLIIIS